MQRMLVGGLWRILHRSGGVKGVCFRDLDREVVGQFVGFLRFVCKVGSVVVDVVIVRRSRWVGP